MTQSELAVVAYSRIELSQRERSLLKTLTAPYAILVGYWLRSGLAPRRRKALS